jgi:hypothetical protein
MVPSSHPVPCVSALADSARFRSFHPVTAQSPLRSFRMVPSSHPVPRVSAFANSAEPRPTGVDLDLTSLYPIPNACEGSLLCLLAASVPEGSALYHSVLRCVNRLDGFFSFSVESYPNKRERRLPSPRNELEDLTPGAARPSLVSDFFVSPIRSLAHRF